MNETSWSTSWRGTDSRVATASSEASDTSSAIGYEKSTCASSIVAGPRGMVAASGTSSIIGTRSRTSKIRSNDTSVVMTSRFRLESWVSGA